MTDKKNRVIRPKDPSTVVVNELSPEANHKLHVLVAKLWKEIQLKKASEEQDPKI